MYVEGRAAADLREDENFVSRLEQLRQHLVQHLQLSADVHQVLVNPVKWCLVYRQRKISLPQAQCLYWVKFNNVAED
jgi:hypothetical protein